MRKVIDRNVFLNSNPEWLSQRLLAIRLYMGLPCLEGPLSIQSLENETIRRSVAAYYYMIMHSEMPDEPVHFGVQHVRDYKLMMLVSTQKPDVFVSKFHYGYKFGDLWVNDMSIVKYLETMRVETMPVLTTVHSEIPSNSCEVLGSACMFGQPDVVVTPSLKPVVRDNNIDCARVPVDEEFVFEEMVSYTGEHSVGTRVSVFMPGMNDLYDMCSIDITGEEMKKQFILDGIKNITPLIEWEKNPRFFECVVEKSGGWSIVIKYFFKCDIIAKYLPSNIYAPRYDRDVKVKRARDYMMKLQNRIVKYFWWIVEELLKLPQTQLVRHNIAALTRYRMPFKMPSKRLIDQSLHMIGRIEQCSFEYEWYEEDWEFRESQMNWCDVLSRAVMELTFFRNLADLAPVSFFFTSRYNADVFSDWMNKLEWDDHGFKRSRYYMRYSDVLHYLQTGEYREYPQLVKLGRIGSQVRENAVMDMIADNRPRFGLS